MDDRLKETKPMNITPAAATIISALISGAVALLVSAFQMNKSMALVEYKIEELRKGVEKHNQLVERTAINERDIKTAFNRIDEIRQDIKEVTK